MQQEELLKGLQMVYPEPDAVYRSPLAFRFRLVTQSDFSELMETYAGRRWLCLQLDGSWRRCIPIESGTLIQEAIDVGNHTARLVLFDSPTTETGKHLMQSELVAFTILSTEDFTAVLKQQRLDDLALYGAQTGEEDMGVVEWYRLRKQGQSGGNGKDSAYVTHEVDAATGDSRPVDDIKTEPAHNSPTDPRSWLSESRPESSTGSHSDRLFVRHGLARRVYQTVYAFFLRPVAFQRMQTKKLVKRSRTSRRNSATCLQMHWTVRTRTQLCLIKSRSSSILLELTTYYVALGT